MGNSELNRRLLKRAESSWLNSWLERHGYDAQLAANAISRHIQNIGNVPPSSPQYRQYLTRNGLTLEDADHIYRAGQGILGSVRNPEDFDLWQQGKVPDSMIQEFSPMLNSVALPEAESTMRYSMPAFNFPGVPGTKVKNVDQLTPTLRLLSRTPTGRTIWNPDGTAINPSTPLFTKYLVDGDKELTDEQIAAIMPFRANPKLKDTLYKEVREMIGEGAASGFDRNSPLMKDIVAEYGQQTLQRKVDDWFSPTGSGFSKAMNGVSHWLLKLLSMLPGYKSILNWYADWQHGDKFKALPGQIQQGISNYGLNKPDALAAAKSKDNTLAAASKPIKIPTLPELPKPAPIPDVELA